MSAITLESLVGRHTLTGVDNDHEAVKNEWGDGFEDCDTIRFILDGITYRAIEDPGDGYRSSMRSLSVSTSPVANTFGPIPVLARMAGPDDYGASEVLELIDERNGKTILAVGTDNEDAYYPSWVGRWTPENLWVAP